MSDLSDLTTAKQNFSLADKNCGTKPTERKNPSDTMSEQSSCLVEAMDRVSNQLYQANGAKAKTLGNELGATFSQMKMEINVAAADKASKTQSIENRSARDFLAKVTGLTEHDKSMVARQTNAEIDARVKSSFYQAATKVAMAHSTEQAETENAKLLNVLKTLSARPKQGFTEHDLANMEPYSSLNALYIQKSGTELNKSLADLNSGIQSGHPKAKLVMVWDARNKEYLVKFGAEVGKSTVTKALGEYFPDGTPKLFVNGPESGKEFRIGPDMGAFTQRFTEWANKQINR